MEKKNAYPCKGSGKIKEWTLFHKFHSFIVIFLCLLFTSPSIAGSIQTCVNDQGKTIFTDVGCPTGFTLKGKERAATKITRRDISPAPVIEKHDTMAWQDHQISLEGIASSWLLTGSDGGEDKILHPQVEFTVHNSSNESLARMKIIILFYDEHNSLFGDTYMYTREIAAGKHSQKMFMAPHKGFIYSGYNEEKITATNFRVDIYGRYRGVKEKIGSLDFFSRTVHKTNSE
ncbi:MAG: DUF4124 domain-containing protein [Deltaproteobacteria bacterium]|nr:DUF4124 domain-containing protein [Deltaproteobacteria bacterium]MBW2658432.1 DUF4124 domain-containing protein [Deltaproteobacteria bacterium]